MKCPSCGAEIGTSKYCEYCGAQITLDMQKEQEKLNKQGCPQCHSTNIEFNRENQGEVRDKYSRQIILRTVGFCKDCGYTWYPDNVTSKEKTTSMVWWVLGWIFFFPIPAMVLIWRKKNTWDTKKKILATVIFWVVLYLFLLANGNPQ